MSQQRNTGTSTPPAARSLGSSTNPARAHVVHAHTQHGGTTPRVNGEALCAKNPREACSEHAGAGMEVI